MTDPAGIYQAEARKIGEPAPKDDTACTIAKVIVLIVFLAELPRLLSMLF